MDALDSTLCGLTFELTRHQRRDARPGLAKMYRVPPDRAWWPAVGAPVERGVRPHVCHELSSQRCRKEVARTSEDALLKMGDGPPGSACRSRPQTTASCWGKEPWW
jgi:hypothetical protein